MLETKKNQKTDAGEKTVKQKKTDAQNGKQT